MEELIKFINALPTPAAIAFVMVLAAVVGVSWRGILQGRKLDPAKDVPSAQVAAVIVDPTALNAATVALNKHTEAIERLTDMFDRVREEMRELSREIGRRA
jgi:hypothetical protein